MTAIPSVTLWLTVFGAGAPLGGPSVLYTRDMPTSFLPAVGDDIELWQLGEDSDGPLWAVKRRYWDADGTCNLTMVDARIDPERVDVAYERGWHSARDGDLPAKLLEGGWRRY